MRSNPLVLTCRTAGIRRKRIRRPDRPAIDWSRQKSGGITWVSADAGRRRGILVAWQGPPAGPWAMNGPRRRWSVFSGAGCCRASRADRGRGDPENRMVCRDIQSRNGASAWTANGACNPPSAPAGDQENAQSSLTPLTSSQESGDRNPGRRNRGCVPRARNRERGGRKSR